MAYNNSHTVRNRQNSNFEAGDLDYFEIVYQSIMFLLLMLKSTEASFPRITLYLSDRARVKIGASNHVLLLELNIDTPHV